MGLVGSLGAASLPCLMWHLHGVLSSSHLCCESGVVISSGLNDPHQGHVTGIALRLLEVDIVSPLTDFPRDCSGESSIPHVSLEVGAKPFACNVMLLKYSFGAYC